MSPPIFPSPLGENQTKRACSWLASKLPWTPVFLAGTAGLTRPPVVLWCSVRDSWGVLIRQCHTTIKVTLSRAGCLAIRSLTDTVTASYPTNMLWMHVASLCSSTTPCFPLLMKVLIASSQQKRPLLRE